MRYLKTFDKFNPWRATKKLVDKWLTKDESTLIEADWYTEEIKELISLGFDGFKNRTIDNIQYYNSKTKDFKIIVKKYWNDDYPVLIKDINISKLYIYRDTYDRYKKFDEFEELLKYIEENIPEEEMAVNKYNL